MKSYYTPEIIKLLKYKEREKANITDEELKELLIEAIGKIKTGEFNFNFTKRQNNFISDNLVEKLIIRKLNQRLRSTYKTEPANRKVIIRQVITLLEQDSTFFIIRTDIKSFFETINRNTLLSKIKQDRILNFESIFLLEKIFENTSISANGLPRGLSVSSTLSELFLRSFDLLIKNTKGVFFYARFVDDIIIFVNTQKNVKILQERLSPTLPVGLHLNQKKTNYISSQKLKENKYFEYLGYSFKYQKISKKKYITNISIAKQKVNRIKSRIVWSFSNFVKNSNYSLLKNRIRFLTGNYTIRKSKKGSSLKAGIYYNYPEVNCSAELLELNTFLHKLISSKNKSLGTKIHSQLSHIQKTELRKLSFTYGFENKICYSFSQSEIKEIKSCWQ
jgi:hypothetical protein